MSVYLTPCVYVCFIYLTPFCQGLECLVSILKCLVEWSRELYIDPSTTGLNAVSPITGTLNKLIDGWMDRETDR